MSPNICSTHPIHERVDITPTPVTLIDTQDAAGILLCPLQSVNPEIKTPNALRRPAAIASITRQTLQQLVDGHSRCFRRERDDRWCWIAAAAHISFTFLTLILRRRGTTQFFRRRPMWVCDTAAQQARCARAQDRRSANHVPNLTVFTTRCECKSQINYRAQVKICEPT
jgi:hypothetical protein